MFLNVQWQIFHINTGREGSTVTHSIDMFFKVFRPKWRAYKFDCRLKMRVRFFTWTSNLRTSNLSSGMEGTNYIAYLKWRYVFVLQQSTYGRAPKRVIASFIYNEKKATLPTRGLRLYVPIFQPDIIWDGFYCRIGWISLQFY